jgi:hypothetical protein
MASSPASYETTADIDFEISQILVRFYTAQERFYEFSENIIDRFSFSQKIEILRKLRLPKKFKSQASAVYVCEKASQNQERSSSLVIYSRRIS